MSIEWIAFKTAPVPPRARLRRGGGGGRGARRRGGRGEGRATAFMTFSPKSRLFLVTCELGVASRGYMALQKVCQKAIRPKWKRVTFQHHFVQKSAAKNDKSRQPRNETLCRQRA